MNQPKCVENIMTYSSATHACLLTRQRVKPSPRIRGRPEEVERAIAQLMRVIASGDAKASPTGRRSCAISAQRCVTARKRWRR
jgi:hypothetical protein